MPILGIIEPPISDVTFLMNFGTLQRLPGATRGAGEVPGCVFINILARTSDLTMWF